MPLNNYDPQYEYKENQFYKEYELQKDEIKKKYPSTIFTDKLGPNPTYGSSEERKLHQQYLKEVAELMFQPNGVFQEFVWDTMSEVEKLEMDRRARGRLSGTGEYS